MPAQTGQSSLLKKLGGKAQQFLEKRKEAEPEMPGGGDLPAGIENGVAQVVLCGFGTVQAGKKNAGALFFQAQAVVKKPLVDAQGIPVAGRRTRIMKNVATAQQFAKGEFDEKAMGWAQDQLKMLAGKGADPSMFTLDRLESTAAMIQKAKPHTLFRTWKGRKQDVRQVNGKWWLCNLNDDGSVQGTVTGKGPYINEEAAKKANEYAGREPMVNHTWAGAVPYSDQAGSNTSAVSYNGQASGDGHLDDAATQAQEEGGADSGSEFNEFQDIGSLVEQAEAEDQEARKKLVEMALAAGVEQEAIDGAEDWSAVAGLITGHTEEAGDEALPEGEIPEEDGEPEEEAWAPEKGEVYGYKPLVKDPKTKKVGRAKKPTDCQVTGVDTDAETVTLKNNTDKKTIYKDVKWSDLIRPEE